MKLKLNSNLKKIYFNKKYQNLKKIMNQIKFNNNKKLYNNKIMKYKSINYFKNKMSSYYKIINNLLQYNKKYNTLKVKNINFLNIKKY